MTSGERPLNKNKDSIAIQQWVIFDEIGKTLTSTLDIKEVLQIIMEKISKLLRPTSWSLLLMDEDSGELFFEVVLGKKVEPARNLRLKVGSGIAGMAAQEGTPILVEDVKKDPGFDPKIDQISGLDAKSIVCAPLKSKGKVLGVIELINTNKGGKFTDQDLTALATFSDYAAIAIENARNYQRVEELTLTDDVTKLFNSRFLLRQLDSEIVRAKRYKSELSLIFLDLDHFKLVNDTHGHLVGSHLLREVGEVIYEKLRRSDYPVRYGGDEFVLLLPQTSKKNAHLVAQRVRTAINERHFLKSQGLTIKITASFGVATYPTDASTTQDLIRMTDQAMYRVKNSTRDGIELA